MPIKTLIAFGVKAHYHLHLKLFVGDNMVTGYQLIKAMQKDFVFIVENFNSFNRKGEYLMRKRQWIKEHGISGYVDPFKSEGLVEETPEEINISTFYWFKNEDDEILFRLKFSS